MLRAEPMIDYLSIDLESPLAMERMDVTALQFPDASFDVVMCNHVLEHVPDDRTAMSELLRVLRPSGWAILQTPYDPSRLTTDEDPSVVEAADRARRFGQADHVRMYGIDLFDRLRGVGWNIRTVDVGMEFGASVVAKNALLMDEPIVVGRHVAGANSGQVCEYQ